MICPACGAENDDLTDNCFQCGKGLYSLTEGALLASRYEILSHLGRGGMGIVYKAHDRSLDEMVALKVLRFDVARTGDVARRFRSEIKLARKVRHPNVCGIHEYGEEGPYRFIVMELIEGKDLRRILRERGAFPPEEACSLAIEVTEGLQAIHDVGIVHRDLKSPNIMLDRHGRVRLMDFGIAKQFGADVSAGSATATGLVLGTPEYMSPEQARGQKIDFRSDIYALGILVYELLTGHVPFKGETPLETIFKHLQETPVFAGPEAPGIPEPVVPVLTKALAKVPGDRYGSAREMAQALGQAHTQAFGGRVEATTAVTLTATAPDPHPLPHTQTLPTPTPSRASTEVPTAVPTTVPTEVPSGAPTEVPSGAPTAVPTGAPTVVPDRTVVSGDQPTATTSSRPAPPGGRRAVWIAAGSFAAAACLAGVLYMGSGGTAPESPTTPKPTPEAAVPSPALSPTPGEPAPPSAAGSPPNAETPSPSPPRSTPKPAGARSEAGANPPPIERRQPVERRPVQERPPTARSSATSPPAAATPTPAPTPTPNPTLKLTPVVPPPPPPEARTPVPATGFLQLRILPWAEVSIDGRTIGTTPLRPVGLEAGEHRVVLSHPGYKPLQKSVLIHADETTTLEVDLSYEAFPR